MSSSELVLTEDHESIKGLNCAYTRIFMLLETTIDSIATVFFQKLYKSKGFGASFLTCASWWNYFWQYMLQGSKLLDPIWKPLNLLDWNLTRELRSEYWERLLFFSAWEIKSNHISFNGSPRQNCHRSWVGFPYLTEKTEDHT